jgi:hypothetical protein
MKNWYSSIYKSLIIASVLSFIIYFFTSGNVSLGALISGYSVLTLSIMMILYIILYNLLQTNQNGSFLQVLLSMITTTGPFLLMFGVIGFVLYMIITYKNRILAGHVSTGYTTFTNITIIIDCLIFVKKLLKVDEYSVFNFCATNVEGLLSRNAFIVFLNGSATRPKGLVSSGANVVAAVFAAAPKA